MKIVHVVGARPQFIKAAPLLRALGDRDRGILVHTGQHYDYEMSRIFFEGLDIPEPDHDLDIGSGSHAEQTAGMMVALEPILLAEKPDIVVVYGDTNSTVAAALAASKLNLSLAHVEAGLRSFNRAMPEEINRGLTDRVSDLLFCPTPQSVRNLEREGMIRGAHWVGDVMFDVAVEAMQQAEETSRILNRLGLSKGRYLLATFHRAGNTDVEANLHGIVEACVAMREPLVLPLHPRTRQRLEMVGLYGRLHKADHVVLTEPLAYLDFVVLQIHARKVLTDSGGVQKEACFFGVPCITLREETEWVETVDCGWNVLVGADARRILEAVDRPIAAPKKACEGRERWDGRASERIAEILTAFHAEPSPRASD